MTYESKLASILEEILNEIEFDPDLCEYTIETTEGGIAVVGSELASLVDRANDLIFGTDESDMEEYLSSQSGYSTEENE